MSAFLKWTAGILAVLAFLAWPYYSLYQLARGIGNGDAVAINRLVDWDSVRPSVKAQAQVLMRAMAASQRGNTAYAPMDNTPMGNVLLGGALMGGALPGNISSSTAVNTFIDTALTPEGITKMMGELRSRVPEAARNMQPAGMPMLSSRDLEKLLGYVKYAFFVSPIHFRLAIGTGNRSEPTALSITMTLGGKGWQVTDVQVPVLNTFASAQLDPARAIRTPAAAR